MDHDPIISMRESSSSSGGNGNEDGGPECNICFDLARDPVITLCRHLYCWPCLYMTDHGRKTGMTAGFGGMFSVELHGFSNPSGYGVLTGHIIMDMVIRFMAWRQHKTERAADKNLTKFSLASSF